MGSSAQRDSLTVNELPLKYVSMSLATDVFDEVELYINQLMKPMGRHG